ncbi:MAG TPA: hypothetical protein PKN17_03625, partial [Bacillota bacterium]|nr:hypothetical protein [Bacillota bacterium]
MKKLHAYLLLFLLAAIIGCIMAVAGARAAASPLYIDSEEDFLNMSADGVYYLSQNITLTSSWDGGEFFGTFDGGGHTVTLEGVPMFILFSGKLQNIRIEGSVGAECAQYPDSAGTVACRILGGAEFYNVDSYADIHAAGSAGGIAGSAGVSEGTDTNINFYNCVFEGNIHAGGDGCAGGMVGMVDEWVTAIFSGCVNKGQISGGSDSGGICGGAFGAEFRAEGCLNTGTITSSGSCAGGIIGQAKVGSSAFFDCENHGGISAGTQAGGIIGYAMIAGAVCEISHCYNDARVESETRYAGGIAGYLNNTSGGVTINCAGNSGDIAAYYSAAGIVGYGPTSAQFMQIEYCFSNGNITAGTYVSGFSALCSTQVQVSNCYASGSLTATGTTNPTCAVLRNSKKGANTTTENVLFPEGYADCLCYTSEAIP